MTNQKTIPQVRAWALAKARQQAADASLEWVEPLRRVTYPTGLRGVWGRVKVTAPGYRPHTFLVTSDAYGIGMK